MPKPTNPVSEEAAAKFTAYVATWREILSLGDWRVGVSERRSSKRVMAEVSRFDLEQRLATIKLGKDFGGTKVTDDTLKETALHEMLHVFLFELVMTAIEEGEPNDKVGSAEHRVINVLERLLADKS
jgi:hypothetical protein